MFPLRMQVVKPPLPLHRNKAQVPLKMLEPVPSRLHGGRAWDVMKFSSETPSSIQMNRGFVREIREGCDGYGGR